jgi:hypothetical protein
MVITPPPVHASAALLRCLSEGTAVIEFKDPDPFQEFTYPGILEAKIAIANYLGIPLAKLPEEDRQKIDAILASTLLKKEILDEVRCYFRQQRKGVKDVK